MRAEGFSEDPQGQSQPVRVQMTEDRMVHDGFFRLRRLRLHYERFDGTMSREVALECVERGEAVAVLLYHPQSDRVGLIRQFRVGDWLAGGNGWTTEIVAGTCDGSRDYPAVARREVREEAGLETTRLIPMHTYFISPSGSTERIHLFLGLVEGFAPQGGGGLEEEDEDIAFFHVPLDQALTWVDEGRITPATALLALHWLARHRHQFG